MNSCEGSSVLEQIVGLSPSSGPSTSLELTKSISPGEEGSDAPSLSPSGGADGLTQSPTKFRLEDGFYFGEDYLLTVSNCNEAVKCPGGNDDFPTGQARLRIEEKKSKIYGIYIHSTINLFNANAATNQMLEPQ
jgi:hypothetical protein